MAKKRLDILAKKDDILKWVSENLPNAEIARRLNCKIDTLKSYYKIFGIDYKGNQNRANMKHHESRKPIQEILNGNSSNSTPLNKPNLLTIAVAIFSHLSKIRSFVIILEIYLFCY